MLTKEIIKSALYDETPYRMSLNIARDMGFGLEVEIGVPMEETVFDRIATLPNELEIGTEKSIKDSIGIEIRTPVLYNNMKSWKMLKKVSDKLMEGNEYNFSECSLQVNIDNYLDDDDMLIFLKLYAVYEKIIYGFSRGYDKYLRDTISEYADSLIPLMYDNIRYYGESVYTLKNLFYHRKSTAISLKKKGYLDCNVDIIEFRTPNGTNDAWLWQNYVNVFANLLRVAKNKAIDQVILDYDFYNALVPDVFVRSYEETFLKSAIEFMNLVFDNDEDKVYFMKQYLYNTPKDKVLKFIK